MNIATSPGLDTATKELHILISISTRLQGNKDLFSDSIRNAIKRNIPTKYIFYTIKSAAEDNYKAVVGLFGEELTKQIISA